MRTLLPTASEDLNLEQIVACYAYPDDELSPNRAWIRANMVATVDGAVTGGDFRSGSISTPADHRVFSILRGLADVVLVGAGTARIEKYGPARAQPEFAEHRARAGQTVAPRIAVVSNRLDLDVMSSMFTEAAEPTIVFTSQASPAKARRRLETVAEVVIAGADRVDVRQLARELARRGALRVLCEGGPTLLAELAASGLLDELCLTVSPLIVGGAAARIVNGAETYRPLALTHLMEEDGSLFGRWAVRQA